ncbi:MAG: NosD domain-containing protein, partial [Promethearchaeota archaeon]
DVDIASVYLRNNCNNNTIYDNNVTGSLYGVDIYDFCINNLIDDNFGQFNSYGIRIRSDCTQNRVINNKFLHGGSRGISLDDSMNNSIIDNELIDNGYYGIDISYYSNNNKIINNTIVDVSHGGIILTGSSENNISNNKMFGCGIYVSGSTVQRVSNFIYANNRANGKPIYYYLNQDGLNAANFVNAGQIILVNCTNCDIISFTFYNVTVGISLLFTSYSNVLLNTVTECTNGYYQDGGQENQVVFNTFSQNIAGIDLENTNFNNVSHNTVNSNGNYGIWIGSYSRNNTIHDNVGLSNGLGGLHIRMSDNNTCTKNRFSGTSRGIELLSDADQNRILNNEIWSVQFGFLLQMGCDSNIFKGNNITSAFGSGIQLASSSSFNLFKNNIIQSCSGNGVYITQSTAINNTFSHNAFIQNNVQGQDSGTDTHWTKNDIGNYWDDYIGNDTNNDKIGDTPYFIPPNGIDDRPLMEYPFVGNPPLLAELLLFDYDITNSSLTITIKNSGDENTTGVEILVGIESIPIILYNNSLTPFDLQTNETEVIVIDLISFHENFTWGEIYNITVNIDPQNQIVEQNELNNQVDLEFHYRPNLFLPDLVVDNYILTSGELWINITNIGNENASAVEIVVEIELLSLILFNNTLSPVDINISSIFGIYVNLSDYSHLFTVGETYNITIRIDPRDTILELNENNNSLILQYYYLPSGTFPDLLIQTYTLINDILTITILNNGTEIASNITLFIWIDSLSLTLYNGTITPIALDVNQTTVIVLDLEDFFSWFIDGTDYVISALVDPSDEIIELKEDNNQIDIPYSYDAETLLPPSIPWMIEFIIISALITLAILIISIRKKENI